MRTLPITAAYQMDALGNVPVQGQNRRLANHNLKPELQNRIEFDWIGALENLAKLDLFITAGLQRPDLGRQLGPSTGYTET